jgi:hypothetical protein
VGDRQPERTAVLVIRLWVEGEPAAGLRARVTQTLDVTKAEQVSTVTASKQEIHEIVDRWFESFLATSGVSTRPV